MKAIETRYKGYRFRSRTEARWAVFFDNLTGIEWEYEPEGYEFDDGTRYLPDFRVHHPELSDVWFEVKPQLGSIQLISDQEWAKMQAFNAEGEMLILLDGPPELKKYWYVGNERLKHSDYIFNNNKPGFWQSQHMLDLEKAVNASRSYRYDK